jgi:hypothetical protein
LKIGDVRRVADEMMAGFNYILDLWRYFQWRNRYLEAMSLYEDGLVSEPPKDRPPALPNRPRSPLAGAITALDYAASPMFPGEKGANNKQTILLNGSMSGDGEFIEASAQFPAMIAATLRKLLAA